jgi:hypothetical protein
MATKTIDDIQPNAVMSPNEQGRWGSLPPDEQLVWERTRGQGSLRRNSVGKIGTESHAIVCNEILSHFYLSY